MGDDRRVLYLIDASAFIYRAFYALPPLTGPGGEPTNAVFGFTTMLLKLLREKQPTFIAAVFDAPGPSFRKEQFAAYKANRAGMPDDLRAQVPAVQEIVAACNVPVLSISGVEADDVIATLTERALAESDLDVVVITSDKDLMQLVGPRVKLWDTMRDRWIDRTAVEAKFGVSPDRVVEVLGLMGDTSDNIPGVRGIGEKTAQTLIQKFGSIENLLDRVDEVEKDKSIRGGKKVATLLREQADGARLSRSLASLKSDLDLPRGPKDLTFDGLDMDRMQPIFVRYGFQTLLRSALPPQTAALSITACDDDESWERLAAEARSGGRIAFACDSSEDGSRRVSLSVSGDAVVVSNLDRPESRQAFETMLGDLSLRKVGHDLKKHVLALGGAVAFPEPSFDTMIASYVLEATPHHRLAELATDIANRVIAAGGEEEAAAGVASLPAIYERLEPRLDELGVRRLFDEIEMPLVAVLTAMERRGMLVDTAILREIGTEITGELARLEKEIHELAGGPFHIGSPIQLREVLFDRLKLSTKGVKRGKTGLSTDVDVLTRLAADHPLPAKILEHRSLAKVMSTYIEALPAAVRKDTGRLHTTFNQAVAVTGRLSSSDPNLQNIPIRTEYGRRIRAAFRAAPGCVLVGADYSQIELRVLAHLSEDAALVRAFQADLDIHAATAAEIFGVLPGTVTADMRRVAKVINFGVIYGMGPQRLARELSIPMARAEQFIASYFERYSGVKDYLARVREEARVAGFVTTLFGRRRTLPDIASGDPALVQAAERTATNTPIQGTAADLIKLAMVAIDRRFSSEGIRGGLILQVHDELIAEVAEEDADRALRAVREEMEAAHPLKVALRVDAGLGQNWAEIH